MNLNFLNTRQQQAWERVLGWDGQPIYNPEFVELKETLSRLFESAAASWSAKGLVEPAKPDYPRNADNSPKSQFCYELVFSHPNLVQLGTSKLPGKIEAYTAKASPEEMPFLQWHLDYYRLWKPVGEKLAAMKATVLPGRRPSAEKVEEERLRSQPASIAGRKLIADKIEEVTREWRVAEIARVEAHHRSYVTRYNAEKQQGETPMQFWQRVFKARDEERPPYGRTPEQRKVSDDFDNRRAQAFEHERETSNALEDESYPRKRGEQHAASIIETFTLKMQQKLGFATTQLGSIETSTVRSAGPTLDCTLAIKLASGASFNVRNQIVGVYSTRTPFYRFPSTFHDVKVPGHRGTIAMASEEEMNALFSLSQPRSERDQALAQRLAQQAKERIKGGNDVPLPEPPNGSSAGNCR